MELEFIPVEEFYFALTLAVRTLTEIEQPGLVEQVQASLELNYGQASTVAAANQNNYNYVFYVSGVDNRPAPQLILSVADWQGNLRLSSDYGWMLDSDRKPIRTEKFQDREKFTQQVRSHLETWLNIKLIN